MQTGNRMILTLVKENLVCVCVIGMKRQAVSANNEAHAGQDPGRQGNTTCFWPSSWQPTSEKCQGLSRREQCFIVKDMCLHQSVESNWAVKY